MAIVAWGSTASRMYSVGERGQRVGKNSWEISEKTYMIWLKKVRGALD